MGRESFGVVGFDLGPLLQGQTGIAKLKSRCATEQSTLHERGQFHEYSILILKVEYLCIYNNLQNR